METLTMIWIALLIGLVVVELLTMGLTTIWFAGGALVGLIANMVGAPVWVQWTLFVVVSCVLLIATRPLVVRYINKTHVKTNAESLIGETAIVNQEIDNLKAMGSVQVNGQDWTARSISDDNVIATNKLVVIKAIEGVKLIVEATK